MNAHHCSWICLSSITAHYCTLLFLNMSLVLSCSWICLSSICLGVGCRNVIGISIWETANAAPAKPRISSRQICYNKSITMEKGASFQYLFLPPVCLHKNKKTTLKRIFGVNHLEHILTPLSIFFTWFSNLSWVLLPCLLENPFATNYAAKDSRVTNPRQDLGFGIFVKRRKF